jgi:adenylosuccinate synthase
MAVRTGGSNTAHSIDVDGRIVRLQNIPTAAVNPSCLLGIAAGAVLDGAAMLRDIEQLALSNERLMVDPQATILRPAHVAAERNLKSRIGSTGEGVGAAVADRILRSSYTMLARDVPWLKPYLGDVAGAANRIADDGGEVLLEGTQGFGLSLFHGAYPYVTDRDTTAAAICSESGISPRLVTDIVLVARAFPIRVGGPSGPLASETTWDAIAQDSGSVESIAEQTAATGLTRRVSLFDIDAVRRATLLNRPTQVALMCLEHIDTSNFGVVDIEQLSARSLGFACYVQSELAVPLTLLGTGVRTRDFVDLRPRGIPPMGSAGLT